MSFTYGRKDKLKSRKLTEELFAKGRSVSVFPIKVFYTWQPAGGPALLQTGVGVSARNFRKAVERNRIKRLLREAYRLQKAELASACTDKQKGMALFFLYVGKEMPDQALITDKMRKALSKLAEQIN